MADMAACVNLAARSIFSLSDKPDKILDMLIINLLMKGCWMPFFYQEARPWGNLRPGFSFPFPDRQRPQDVVLSILETTTCRCRDWGRDVPVIDRNTAVFTFVVAGAVVIGITAFEILLGKAKWSNARQCVARNGSAR